MWQGFCSITASRTHILMKKITYLLFAATVLVASCKKDDPVTPPPPPPAPTAKIKFTNATTDSNPLGIKINDVSLADAQSLAFLTTTGYLTTAYGASTKISFVSPSTGIVFQETTMNISQDNFYSAFVGGGLPSNISMVVTNDNLTAPAAGKSKIRMINLSSDNYNLSFYVGGPMLDSNITYQEYTPFYEVNAGTNVNIIAQDPANVGYQRTLTGQTLEAGKIYTVMFSGKNGASGDADLKLTLLNNN